MTHYFDLLLLSKTEFLGVLLFLILMTRFVFKSTELVITSICINYGVYFSVAFYIQALIHNKDLSHLFRIIFLLFFETIILFLFLLILRKFLFWAKFSKRDYHNHLPIIFITRLIILLYLVSTGSYGIYSLGERIDFVFANWYLKYLEYFSGLLSFIQLIIISINYNLHKRHSLWTVLTIIQVIIISSFSGSKGAWVLWMIAFVGLTYKTLIQKRILFKLLISFSIVVGLVVESSLKYFSLSRAQFIDLAFSRFFLNNDARALALDFTDSVSQKENFFINSWRSISGVLGEYSAYPPIGNHLSNLFYGSGSILGSNSSLSAIITYFAHDLSLLPIIFICILLISFYQYILKKSLYNNYRFLYFSLSLFIVPLYSQDFLSFQLVSRIILFMLTALLLYNLLKRTYK